jgi:hypothetical protein
MQTQRFSDRSSQSRFDAEQSLNARCSELVLMRVYFTQQQQTKKKRKGAKFLDRACVRCGCAIQVADGAIKAQGLDGVGSARKASKAMPKAKKKHKYK